MDILATVEKRPHVIFVPFPAQSHVKAMLKLAVYLHHKGLRITFINTENIHKRLLNSGGLHCLDGSPGFRFKTIPDGIPSNSEGDYGGGRILDYFETNFLTPFVDLVVKLPDTPTCIISDGCMSLFTIDAAKELGIPIMSYWTFSACGFMGMYQVQSLIDKGLVPLKDESDLTNGYLETVIDWIPGMEGIRLKDMCSIIRTTNLDDKVLNFCISASAKSHNVIHNIFHTFDSLETSIVNAFSSMFPQVYTVGPLQLHLDQISENEKQTKMSSFNGYSLWKEESECLQWLESKEPNSVIYVNYGSFTKMSLQDLTEFGWGLANSSYYFLWIIRSDLVVGETAALSPEYKVFIENKGFIASWCSQEMVLNHPSVGGFLTHCGWGSTIESLSAGVPMICWPYLWDQVTNCRYICKEWEVGLEMGNEVKREEVSKLVQELMGEGGNKMRNKAIEWQEKARAATRSDGSSALNLSKLIEEIVMLSRN
uniref:UDP-glycosyltransferase 85C2-like n=1 Tax=Erigeron canadensis TaxID=72917 RepID=UPI001CB8B0A9|nr:UDP-glycosyltransferase 85C2-like [Erigeron canadensis]